METAPPHSESHHATELAFCLPRRRKFGFQSATQISPLGSYGCGLGRQGCGSVLVLRCAFVVKGGSGAGSGGGDLVLGGRGRRSRPGLGCDRQETGSTEMCCQTEGAVEPLLDQALSYRKFLGGEWAMFVCGGRGDKASGGSIGVGRHFDKNLATGVITRPF